MPNICQRCTPNCRQDYAVMPEFKLLSRSPAASVTETRSGSDIKSAFSAPWSYSSEGKRQSPILVHVFESHQYASATCALPTAKGCFSAIWHSNDLLADCAIYRFVATLAGHLVSVVQKTNISSALGRERMQWPMSVIKTAYELPLPAAARLAYRRQRWPPICCPPPFGPNCPESTEQVGRAAASVAPIGRRRLVDFSFHSDRSRPIKRLYQLACAGDRCRVHLVAYRPDKVGFAHQPHSACDWQTGAQSPTDGQAETGKPPDQPTAAFAQPAR
ncbi:unnamed protein product [Protopolystoma xenopodis]|uniref:Uncharacterized protein n=1 Tax=Protopolystoma xenopodis TaxID=117903 RepID=A0A3S4ZUH8_9PLAT|nr:unnamed protein product [Protopolystoma xenopodis]